MSKFIGYFSGFILMILILAAAAGLMLWRAQDLRLYSIHSSVSNLQPGDLVVETKTTPELLKTGNVVSYIRAIGSKEISTQEVKHVDKSSRRVITTNSESVPFSFVTGKLVKSVPKAGYGLDIIRNRLFLAEVIYLPAAFIIGLESKRVLRFYARRAYHLHPPL